MFRRQRRGAATTPKVVVAILAILVAMGLAGSIALAGSVEDMTKVAEKARLKLVPMGVDSGATGEV